MGEFDDFEDILEGAIVDVASEGTSSTVAMIILSGALFGGGVFAFKAILELLINTL